MHPECTSEQYDTNVLCEAADRGRTGYSGLGYILSIGIYLAGTWHLSRKGAAKKTGFLKSTFPFLFFLFFSFVLLDHAQLP